MGEVMSDENASIYKLPTTFTRCPRCHREYTRAAFFKLGHARQLNGRELRDCASCKETISVFITKYELGETPSPPAPAWERSPIPRSYCRPSTTRRTVRSVGGRR
jgi:hypothetical protein